MSKKPVYECLSVTVRDKTVSSHTSGSVTTTTQGKNVSVRNNIGTNVKLEVVLEFPDGDFLPIILINESLHAPIGKKILMAFKKGEPVAYQVTPIGEIYPLGYIRDRDTFTAQEFMLMALPVVGTMSSLGLASVSDTYYENGEMKVYNGSRITAAVGMVAIALSIYITKGWLAYVVGTALCAVPNTISRIYHGSKENTGRKLMLEDIRKEFDKLKSDL